MTDSRTFDRALVDSALATSWPPLRATASLAVGQVGATHGSAGAPLLRELLNDADITVASNAAYALGLLRDSASVRPLCSGSGRTSRVAREAAWALGEIGAPARAAVINALSSPGSDEARTIQILLASAKLRPVPVAEIRRYLTAGNRPSVLWAAAYAIARTRASAGARDLVCARHESRSRSGICRRPRVNGSTCGRRNATNRGRLRFAALRPASAHGPRSPGDSRRWRQVIHSLRPSIAVLERLALDPHPHVRINAVRSLATYGARARSRSLPLRATRIRIRASLPHSRSALCSTRQRDPGCHSGVQTPA